MAESLQLLLLSRTLKRGREAGTGGATISARVVMHISATAACTILISI